MEYAKRCDQILVIHGSLTFASVLDLCHLFFGKSAEARVGGRKPYDRLLDNITKLHGRVLQKLERAGRCLSE